MYDILTIGDALVDTIITIEPTSVQTKIDNHQSFLCLHYGEKIVIENMTNSIGGNAANVAAGLASFKKRSAILTEIGTDPQAEFIISELKKLGVDTKEVKQKKHADTRVAVVLNYQSERTILSHHSANPYKKRSIPQAKLYYLTSVGKGFSTLAKQLKTRKKKSPSSLLALNPGSYQMRYNISDIRKLLPAVDLLFLNKEEAQIISKQDITDEKHLLRALSELGAKQVIITDGSRGSFSSNGVQSWHMPIYPLKAKAKTGAGDAFASGFLAATINGKTVPESMQYGSANAASVITQLGAQHGLLTERKAKKLIQTYKQIKPISL